METSLKKIVSEALSLPTNSRAFLADKLLESLDFEDNFEVSDEWIDEAKRRARELDQGKVRPIPGKQSLSYLRKKAR